MRAKLLPLTFVFLCSLIVNSLGQPAMSQNYHLPKLFNDDGDGFVIIAHRGASAYYPENTMAAFRGAVDMTAEMIELDVMLSKDGVPVVFHDERLNVHTDGRGKVSNHTVKELKKLDAGSWFSEEFSGQKIPTLEEVLKFAADKIALNIEIKTEAVSDQLHNGVEEKSLELVEKYGMEEHVLFSSFDYRAVEHLRELDSDISVALLHNNYRYNRKLPYELVQRYKADAFNCSYRQLTKRRLANLREHDIPTFIYTVDAQSRMRKLITAGVTGIFTNKPDLLRSVVEDYHQK